MTMPTDPGAQVAGRLEVPVVADLDGFRKSLVDGVNDASKGVNATVGVKVDSTGLRKELQRAVKAAQKGIQAQVGINWNATQLRQRLQKQVDKAAAGVKAKVGVDLDEDNLRQEFQRAVDKAAAGVKGKVKVQVEVDQDQARQSLNNAFSTQKVRVRVDEDGLRGDIARIVGSIAATANVGGSNADPEAPGSGMPGRPPRTTDPEVGKTGIAGWYASFKATLAAARKEKVDVPVNVDPKSDFGGGAKSPRLRAILRGALIGSMVALIQPAIATIAGAVTPIAALVGPLGQAVGSLGAGAPLIAAAITAVGAGVIGFQGLGDALGAMSEASKTAGKTTEQLAADQEKLEQALSKLPEPMRDTAVELFEVGKAFKPVREAVQKRLFEKLAGHIEAPLKRALPTLEKGLTGAADQVGLLLQNLSHVAGSERFLTPLSRFFDSLDGILAPLRRAATPLMLAVADFLGASAPAAERLAVGFERGAQAFGKMVEEGAKNGSLLDFLMDGIDQAGRLWRITKDTFRGLTGLAKGASDAGNTLLVSLEKNIAKFAEWANSPDGQKSIKAFMDDMLPVFYEVVGLIGDIAQALGRLSRDPDTAKLIKQIRDELVPALERFLQALGDSLAPAVIDAISSIVTSLAELGEAGSGIAYAVQAIDLLFDGLNWLFQNKTAGPLMEAIAFGLGLIAGTVVLRTGLAAMARLLGLKGIAGALTSLNGKSAVGGLAKLTSLFGLKLPSWLGGGKGLNPDGTPKTKQEKKDDKNTSKSIQRVTWGPKPLPVYLLNPPAGAGKGKGGADGDKPTSKRVPQAKPTGLIGRAGAGIAGAIGLGLGAIGLGVTAKNRKPGTGPDTSAGRRAEASRQGARALDTRNPLRKVIDAVPSPKGALGTIGGLAKKIPGKGTIVGILGSLAAAPIAKKITGDGTSTARRAAGGALNGAVNGAAIGGLVGSVVPVVGTAVGAAAGGAAGGIYGAISKGFPEAETKVKAWAAGLGGLAVGAVGKAGSKGKAFTWVAKQADEAIPAVKTAFSKVGPAVSGALAAAGGVARTGMGKVKTAITEGLVPAVKSVAQRGGEIVKTVGGKLGEAAKAAREKSSQAAGWVSESYGKVKGFATSRFEEARKATVSKLTETAGNVRQKAGEAATRVKDGLAPVAANARSRFEEGRKAAASKFDEVKNNVLTKAKEAANNVKTGLANAGTNARSRIEEVRKNAASKFDEAKKNILTKAKEAAANVKTGLAPAGSHSTTAFGKVKSEGERLTKGLVDRISGIFNPIKEKFAKPVRYIGNTVMGGLRTAFNKVSGIVSGPQIGPINLGFARGGVVPGYAPGKDTQLAAVSPGEGWLVPEAVRGLARDMGTTAHKAIDLLNSTYTQRVKRPAFAKGGVVSGGIQRFHLGGITHNAAHAREAAQQASLAAAAKARGVLGAAGDGIADVAGGAKDIFIGGLRKAFDAVAKPLIDRILPSIGRHPLARLGLASGKKAVGSLGTFLTKKDKEASASVGGSPNGVGGRLGPRAAAAHRAVRAVFGFQGTIGGYANRNIAGTNTPSKHSMGKAIDVMTHGQTSTLGEAIARYFINNRAQYGVDNVIVNRRIANSRRGWGLTARYGGANPHTDHPHIDFFSKGGIVERIARGVGGMLSGMAPALGRGATVLPRPGGTIARLAESGRAESVVDTGKVNELIDRALREGAGGKGRIVFEEGSIVVQNPLPETAGQSIEGRLRSVAAFGLFG